MYAYSFSSKTILIPWKTRCALQSYANSKKVHVYVLLKYNVMAFRSTFSTWNAVLRDMLTEEDRNNVERHR